MTTKEFIDELFRASNGGLSRPEILDKVNHYQNLLYSRNCNEMAHEGEFSVNKVELAPKFVLTPMVDKGAFDEHEEYNAGDSFVFNDCYFRAIAPFSGADGVFKYCFPITKYEYDFGISGAKEIVKGELSEGASLWHFRGVFYFQNSNASFVWTNDIEENILNADLIPVPAQVETVGVVEEWTEEVPDFVEIEAREIIEVSDGRRVFEPRIEQSNDPSVKVKVYTKVLPVCKELKFKGYRWPEQLVSQNVQMEVPVAHQEGVLRALVLRAIEEENYGQSVYWKATAEELLKDWFNFINRDKTSPRKRNSVRYNGLAG